MKRLLLLLILILTGCSAVQRQTYVPPTPTPEMLIVRRSDPTPRANPTAIIAEVNYMATAMMMAPQTQKTQSRPTSSFDPVVIGDFKLEYIDNAVKTSILGTKYVEISYRFTNNSEKTTSFGLSLSTRAYQDGIEMQYEGAINSERLTDIRPGVSLIVKDAYELRSDNPVIELEYYPFLEVWEPHVTRTIRLK